jgi:hypothetical protein
MLLKITYIRNTMDLRKTGSPLVRKAGQERARATNAYVALKTSICQLELLCSLHSADWIDPLRGPLDIVNLSAVLNRHMLINDTVIDMFGFPDDMQEGYFASALEKLYKFTEWYAQVSKRDEGIAHDDALWKVLLCLYSGLVERVELVGKQAAVTLENLSEKTKSPADSAMTGDTDVEIKDSEEDIVPMEITGHEVGRHSQLQPIPSPSRALTIDDSSDDEPLINITRRRNAARCGCGRVGPPH